MPTSRVSPTSPRSAVVTGAARGIGRAVAAELVLRGYQVVVTDVDVDAAERTAEAIGARAGWQLDVTDPDANAAVALRARELAPLGVWVCNAGVLFEGDVTAQTTGQVRAMVEVNVLGVLWGVRAAAQAFREQSAIGVRGGQIGILASLSAHAPVPGLAVYAATKAAVLSLTTSLHAELRKDRIGVHALCPDGVSTPMVDGMDPDGGTRAILAAGVMYEPHEVALALVDLLGTRRVYRTMPAWRGAIARTASVAPRFAAHADPVMRRLGRARLRKERRASSPS